MAEAAWIAGISRQAVGKWCNRAGLHMKGMRHEWLIKLRFDIERSMLNGAAPASGRRLTKPELRSRGTKAKAEWDRDHGPH